MNAVCSKTHHSYRIERKIVKKNVPCFSSMPFLSSENANSYHGFTGGFFKCIKQIKKSEARLIIPAPDSFSLYFSKTNPRVSFCSRLALNGGRPSGHLRHIFQKNLVFFFFFFLKTVVNEWTNKNSRTQPRWIKNLKYSTFPSHIY